METETARLFQLPNPHPPSEPLVRTLQNHEANSIKQQWVLVGSDESGWMLEEIDGHYVGIRLAVFEEPIDCNRIIIEPQANLHSILDENRGSRTPYLISVDNALLVGLPILQSERGSQCQRIRLCVKVENFRVQHFRTVEPLGNPNRTFHRYTFEASAPVDQPQITADHLWVEDSNDESLATTITPASLPTTSGRWQFQTFPCDSRNLPIRPWVGDRRVGELTQEWEISQFSSGSIALFKLDGRSCNRSLESFAYDSDRRKITIKIFTDDTGQFDTGGEWVDCGEFSLLGRVIGVRPCDGCDGEYSHQGQIITIQADVCSVRPGSSRIVTVFTVRPINRGNNRAPDKGFTKRDCRFFEGNPFLMCSVQPCGHCGGCKDYAVD